MDRPGSLPPSGTRVPGSDPAPRTLVVGIIATAGPARRSLTPGTAGASQFKPAPSPHPNSGTVDHASTLTFSLPSTVWGPQACPQWLHPPGCVHLWSSMAAHGLAPGGHAVKKGGKKGMEEEG